MKKIYITEEKLNIAKKTIENDKYPILKELDNCHLLNNPSLPSNGIVDFNKTLLKKRFDEIKKQLSKITKTDELKDINVYKNELSKLFKKISDIEKPNKQNLEDICYQSVKNIFNVPEDVVIIDCKLVETVSPKNGFKMDPVYQDNVEFEDKLDMANLKSDVNKREILNAIVEGCSYDLVIQYEDVITKLHKINPELPLLYSRVNVLSDVILFLEDVKLDDKDPQQSGIVEVKIGTSDNKSEIYAQGLIFPVLFTETVKGLLELFISHGLPKEIDKAKFIIGQTDYINAEAWNMRFGVELWRRLSLQEGLDTEVVPYYLMNLSKMESDKFFDIISEIFANTKKGRQLKEKIYNESKHQFEFSNFENGLQIKKIENKEEIDGEFTIDELSDLKL